jgi:hypothetical protein
MDYRGYREHLRETVATLSDAELVEQVAANSETLGEIRAQYGSECSLYGDAWPGALGDLERCELICQVFEAELRARQADRPAPEWEDIPF